MVAGAACPGVCVVKPKRSYKTDKKSGLGEDGSTLTIQGKDVPSVSVTVRVWKQEQLEQLATLIGTLFPAGSAIADPVKVSHPVLAIVGVTALFFESVDGPTQTEPGLWETTFAASEFKPARAAGAGGSPTSATGISAKQKKAMKAAEAANKAGIVKKVVAVLTIAKIRRNSIVASAGSR
jgi:hypothetical protein